MDAGERELFAAGLRQATARHTGPALDDALDDLGWPEALTADPQAAVSLLFEAQGAACATSSALDAVVVAALGVAPEGAGVVLPPLGRTDPPGAVVGESIAVGGLGTAGLGRHDRAVVAAGAGEGWVATVVDTADLDRRTVQGLDPDLGLVEVAGAHVRAVSPPEPPPVPWPSAVAAGQRALAHELVGASRAMLGLARGHALERIQFGRPIASFQAVRHRLAESFVAIEAADAALAAAWDDGTPLGAAVAKAVAGRSARTAARHCQQVLAGIGFTTEHPLHRYVRRVVVLDRLLGDARSLTRSLGDDLVARGSLPAILPL
ncbi:MAG TPA: acyl-CoA dehydrogenase family protein [Acidimicrobiales bacterium]|nr:acyl-CoA dehydrogenase family protein [Acidimicrobiales bacterium]